MACLFFGILVYHSDLQFRKLLFLFIIILVQGVQSPCSWGRSPILVIPFLSSSSQRIFVRNSTYFKDIVQCQTRLGHGWNGTLRIQLSEQNIFPVHCFIKYM